MCVCVCVKLVSVGDVSNVEALVGILGCKASKLLISNLGLPLGSAIKEKAVWNSMLHKME